MRPLLQTPTDLCTAAHWRIGASPFLALRTRHSRSSSAKVCVSRSMPRTFNKSDCTTGVVVTMFLSPQRTVTYAKSYETACLSGSSRKRKIYGPSSSSWRPIGFSRSVRYWSNWILAAKCLSGSASGSGGWIEETHLGRGSERMPSITAGMVVQTSSKPGSLA